MWEFLNYYKMASSITMGSLTTGTDDSHLAKSNKTSGPPCSFDADYC